MNLDIFNLGGYGQFVWSAFFISFFFFYVLYLKTKKEFSKQEKIFYSRFKQTEDLNLSKEKISKEKISANVTS